MSQVCFYVVSYLRIVMNILFGVWYRILYFSVVYPVFELIFVFSRFDSVSEWAPVYA